VSDRSLTQTGIPAARDAALIRNGASDSVFAQLRSGATRRDYLDKEAVWSTLSAAERPMPTERAAGGDRWAALHEVVAFLGCRVTHRGPARCAGRLAGRPKPILHAPRDPPSLKVCDGTKDRKHPLPRGRVGVDPLLEADPMDGTALQGHDGIDAVAPGPPPMIATHPHPTVARAGRIETRRQTVPLGGQVPGPPSRRGQSRGSRHRDRGAPRQHSCAEQTDRSPLCVLSHLRAVP